MRILLVDDDDALMETLAQALIGQRYAVDIAGDGETAQEFVALFSYDLLILDMLLPDTDGLTLCQQLRKEGMTSPILMLTAQDDHQNKVQALDAGADDYVVKPFDFDELCARVRALLRRNTHLAESVLHWGSLSLNPVTLDVAYGDQPLHMTPKEYALLELFLRHPSRVFSLDAIIDNLWSFEDPPSGDAVRTHIKGLRQKLKAGGAPKNFVETVYGLGYRLRPLEEQTAAPAKVTQPSKADISAAVAKAWESHQGTMQERLSVLEATAAALDIGRLSTELQQAGRSQAHKLAGSLGCFGFSKGSKLARELERLLELDAPLGEQHVSRVSHLLQDLRQTLAHGSSQQVVSAAISSSPQLLVVGPSEGFTRDVVADALTVGLRSTTALDPVQAAEMLVSCPPPGQSPDAAVIWVDEANYAEALALVGAIAPRPILLISD
ncbi:MAG: response regulator, partial [Cyanobacteria bacterium P01_D01_bin.14]